MQYAIKLLSRVTILVHLRKQSTASGKTLEGLYNSWSSKSAIAPAKYTKKSNDAGQAFVVGHDWGSVIASHLCLFRPDRVKALVNLSVALSPRDPTTKPTEKMKTAFGEGYYMLRFQEPGRVEEEFARHGCTTVVKRFLLMTSTALFVAPPEKGIIDVIETQSTIPSWITEEEIQYFAKKFEKTGFTGGLNYYRAIDLNWELMGPWTGATITVPTKYIVGDKDLVYTTPGMKNFVHGEDLKKSVPFK